MVSINLFTEKKKTGEGAANGGPALDKREQDNSFIRKLGSWKAGDYKQTVPPTVPVSQQFPNGKFPVGEI